MKKLLITGNLKMITVAGRTILLRKNIKIYTAPTAEEVLRIHRLEDVDLIVTDLDITAQTEESICSIIRRIREDDTLKRVSIITVCENDKSVIELCYASGANSFITKPVDSVELFGKIMKYANISERVSLRVILNVSVTCETRNKYFFANSGNISSTGILFKTDEVIEEDDAITCSFFLGGKLIDAAGKVTRKERRAPDLNFYGLQFTQLDSTARDAIEQYVQETDGNGNS